jgi:hypothetical protein
VVDIFGGTGANALRDAIAKEIDLFSVQFHKRPPKSFFASILTLAKQKVNEKQKLLHQLSENLVFPLYSCAKM